MIQMMLVPGLLLDWIVLLLRLDHYILTVSLLAEQICMVIQSRINGIARQAIITCKRPNMAIRHQATHCMSDSITRGWDNYEYQ